MKKENLALIYQKYRLIIFPAAVVLSCLILIIFVMIPQIGKLLKNSQTEADFKVQADFLETKVEALESLDEEELARKVKYVVASFPPEKDFAILITLLQKIAQESGFTIASLSFGGGKSSQEQGYGITVEMAGPKSLFAGFLNSIETSPRLMRINHIEISSGRSADVIDASLAIEALFAPVPGNLGSVNSPLPQVSQGEEELLDRLARSQVMSLTVVELSSTGKSNPFE